MGSDEAYSSNIGLSFGIYNSIDIITNNANMENPKKILWVTPGFPNSLNSHNLYSDRYFMKMAGAECKGALGLAYRPMELGVIGILKNEYEVNKDFKFKFPNVTRDYTLVKYNLQSQNKEIFAQLALLPKANIAIFGTNYADIAYMVNANPFDLMIYDIRAQFSPWLIESELKPVTLLQDTTEKLQENGIRLYVVDVISEIDEPLPNIDSNVQEIFKRLN